MYVNNQLSGTIEAKHKTIGLRKVFQKLPSHTEDVLRSKFAILLVETSFSILYVFRRYFLSNQWSCHIDGETSVPELQ